MRITEIFTRKNRLLLKAMVSTDFKLRYQQSVLGYVWSILKPLMLFTIMYMVFVRFLKFGADVPHFSVGLLLGTIMWNFFNEATTGGMLSVVNHGDLMRKINFSRYTVVLSAIASALINFGINFVVVLIFSLINGVQLRPQALLMVPIFLELAILVSGVAFFLGALFVDFRDLNPIWEVVMQAGFYATPIIYPISLVTSQAGPQVSRLLYLNPVAQIIQDARHVLIAPENPTIWGAYGSHWWVGLFPVALCLAIFAGGLHYFTIKAKNFAELV